MPLPHSAARLFPATLALAMLALALMHVASAQESADPGTPGANRGTAKPNPTNPGTTRPGAAESDPEHFRFFLTDGTRITGKLSLASIELSTEFGLLEIPAAKLVQVVPGLDQRPDEMEEIQRLIDMLAKGGKESIQAREELIQLGVQVRDLLRREREQADAKHQAEIDKVLATLDELVGEEVAEDRLIPQDQVRTERFTALGKIVSDEFRIETRFGDLTVTMADVERVERVGAGGLPDASKKLDVDGTNLAQLAFKSSGIEVRPGDKVIVKAGGTISRSTSRIYTSTPDGNARFGVFSQDPPIPGGALVAKIGGSGKVMKIGSSSTFVAKQTGVLQFAIGMRPEFVGRYQFNGKYNVSVRVLRGK